MSDGSNDGNSGFVVFSGSCDRYVEQYRAGEITFPAAVGGITKTLVAGGADVADLNTAISSYIGSLQEVDRDRNEAGTRGRHGASTVRVSGDVASGEGRASVRSGVGAEERRSASPVRRGASWTDEEGAEGRAGKEPMFAWLWNKLGGEPTWDLSFSAIEQAHELVVVYERDPKATVRSILACKRRPTFPAGHWRDIIGGRYVDLDKLREDVHSHAMAKPDRYELGDGVKVVLPGASNTAKTKTVIDFNTWDDAWERYFDAVVFAFPMREKELKNYRRWIRRQFQAVISPGRVVGLDRAIRKEAGDGALVALDNFYEWNGLVTQYLSSFGGAEAFGSGPGQRRKEAPTRSGGGRGGGGDTICRGWNAGNCRFPDCRYRHVCNRCGQDHRGSEHEREATGSGSRKQ